MRLFFIGGDNFATEKKTQMITEFMSIPKHSLSMQKMPYPSPTVRTVSLSLYQSALLNTSGVSNDAWIIDSDKDEYDW